MLSFSLTALSWPVGGSLVALPAQKALFLFFPSFKDLLSIFRIFKAFCPNEIQCHLFLFDPVYEPVLMKLERGQQFYSSADTWHKA